MSNQRKLIREGMRSLLAAQVPTAHVVKSMKRALSEGKLPAILVYTPSETPEDDSGESAPREYVVNLTITLEIVTNNGDTEAEVEDALDDLCQLINNAIGTDDTLNDTANDTTYRDYESEIRDDGNQFIATAKMTFNAEYRQVFEPSANELQNFDEMGIAWNIENAQEEDDQAADELTGLYGDE